MRFVLASRRRRVVRMAVALYWRRRRKPPMQQRALRPAIAAAVSNTWLAHFHLHFSALAGERSRREESRPSLPAAVTLEIRRLVTSRHRTTVRTVALSRGAGVPPAARWASRPSVPAVPAPRTLPGAMRAGRPPHVAITPRATDRRVHPLFDRTTRNVFRAVVSKSALTQRIERETSIVSRELRLMRSRTSITRRLQETSIVRVHRPPEIVWRTAPQPGAQTQVINESPLPSPRMPRPAAATLESTTEIPRRAALAALQATDLDPALLDRLTDDVIRRVERRVRIERERRGL